MAAPMQQLPNRNYIQTAQERTPRYLFRYWSDKGSTSAHASEINTPKEIKPKRFQTDPTASQDFFDWPKYKLGTMVMLHTSGNDPETPFSTWSQSLAYVLAWALQAGREDTVDKQTGRICILDTTKVDNVILHTSALEQLVSDNITKERWQYLAFGIISGDGYEAIHVDELRLSGIEMFWNRQHPIDDNQMYPTIDLDSDTQNDVMEAATNVAAWFKPQHQLAVAAHLMAVGNKTDTQLINIARQLEKKYQPPDDWRQDQSLLYYYLDLDGVKEARQAVEITRKVMVITDKHPYGLDTPIVTGITELRLEREEREFAEEMQRRNTHRTQERLPPWSLGMDEYEKWTSPSPPNSGRGSQEPEEGKDEEMQQERAEQEEDEDEEMDQVEAEHEENEDEEKHEEKDEGKEAEGNESA